MHGGTVISLPSSNQLRGFNIYILCCGDIHPLPGPVALHERKPHRIVYSRSRLKQLKHFSTAANMHNTNPVFIDEVKSLNIFQDSAIGLASTTQRGLVHPIAVRIAPRRCKTRQTTLFSTSNKRNLIVFPPSCLPYANQRKRLQTNDTHGNLRLTNSNSIPVRITPHAAPYRNDATGVNVNNLHRVRHDLNTQSTNHPLKFCVLNGQSLNNKSAVFTDYICERKPDIVALTETWFTDKESASRALCTPAGYNLLDHPRSGRFGGGTGVLFRNKISVNKIDAAELRSFEFSEWNIKSGSQRIHLIVIYRPPYADNHPVTTSVFLTEFTEFLESVILSTDPLLITGDFNIHVNAADNPDAIKLDSRNTSLVPPPTQTTFSLITRQSCANYGWTRLFWINHKFPIGKSNLLILIH